MHQTAEHPDPDAVHLNDVVTFLHFLRRSRDGYEICVYWDWASTFLQIPSKPPLDSVQPLSIAARDQVAFWFTHPNILTLQNKVTPPARQKGWDMSAWPLFEECLSMLLKKQENIVDLQTFLAWRRSESVEVARWTILTLGAYLRAADPTSRPHVSASKLATATRTNASRRRSR